MGRNFEEKKQFEHYGLCQKTKYVQGHCTLCDV